MCKIEDITVRTDLADKVEALQHDMSMEALWTALIAFEGYSFYTAKGLKFSYCIRGNEMFVDRKEKSITKATILLAARRVMELEGKVVGPKKLGCFGASYLYPVFLKLGMIDSSL